MPPAPSPSRDPQQARASRADRLAPARGPFIAAGLRRRRRRPGRSHLPARVRGTHRGEAQRRERSSTEAGVRFAVNPERPLRGFGGKTLISLLWLPPATQEENFPYELGIECALLSGLFMRHLQKPLAGMVIREDWSKSLIRVRSSQRVAGFPVLDLFDPMPIQVVDFLPPPLSGRYRCRQADSTGVGFL